MSRSYARSRRSSRTARSFQTVFDLPMATAALPLVRRIIADIADKKVRLNKCQVERRRWKDSNESGSARRRFLLEDQIRDLRAELRSVIDELHQTGVALLDPARGEVGFPTIVNGSLAYLVYLSGDHQVRLWRYRDQNKLRRIPTHWGDGANLSRHEEEEGLLI